MSKKLVVLGWPAFSTRQLNPYNHLLYTAMKKSGIEVIEASIKTILFANYHVIHIHWPEGYLGRKNIIDALSNTIKTILMLAIGRFRGAKIIWTAHNLLPHHNHHPVLLKLFWKILPKILHGIIYLTNYSHQKVIAQYPQLANKPSLIHNFGIGTYSDIYPNQITQADARQKLILPEQASVYLFIGSISRYKNVTKLARVFSEIPDTNAFLLIAGKPGEPGIKNELESYAQIDHRIRLHLSFIKDEELQTFLNASNIAVFPFSNLLNSSSAVMALSFQRPIIVPHSGSMHDLQQLIGPAWIYTYSGSFTAQTLMQAKKQLLECQIHKSKSLDLPEWKEIAQETISFYQKLV